MLSIGHVDVLPPVGVNGRVHDVSSKPCEMFISHSRSSTPKLPWPFTTLECVLFPSQWRHKTFSAMLPRTGLLRWECAWNPHPSQLLRWCREGELKAPTTGGPLIFEQD